jgi:hypothetical protein
MVIILVTITGVVDMYADLVAAIGFKTKVFQSMEEYQEP